MGFLRDDYLNKIFYNAPNFVPHFLLVVSIPALYPFTIKQRLYLAHNTSICMIN